MDDAMHGSTKLTAEIVAAYVSHNNVRREDLAELIAATFSALDATKAPTPSTPEKPVPAISIRKSITPDHLISLEDGKRYKSLKRHLGGRGLTPEQYRSKWSLPSDYPMVAANYAKQRSDLARALGLGRIRKEAKANTPSGPGSKNNRKPRAAKAAAEAAA